MTESKSFFDANGYAVIPSLFSTEECAFYTRHFMELRAKGSYEGDMDGVNATSDDPLKNFPRMIHMHRWDETSLKWMLDAKINRWLTEFFGCEPFAVQTMLYFKPPKARGQALHQDNFYLQVSPGTCIAAWLSLDDADEANGCMRVVPGSHKWDLLCTKTADTTESFTDTTVPLPDSIVPIPVPMKAGDVLFFHGSLVHGSYPNTTSDRFRRSLIGHYIDSHAEQLTGYDQPALRMDGTELTLPLSPGGGACGTWSEESGGRPTISLTGKFPVLTRQVLERQ